MVDDEVSRSIDALVARGRALETELRERNRHLLSLAGIPETGPVTAVLDARGVLSGFTFAPHWRELRDGTQLLTELTNALVRSMFDEGSVGLGNVGSVGPTTPTAPAATTSPEPPEPAIARNAAGTLTITALLGAVMNLQADPRWLEQISDAALSAEVAIVAEEAALASDRDGRLRPAGTEDEKGTDR